MSTIRQLFDPTRTLNRPIEKVITYQNRSEVQMRAEISEYVVTERIEDSFADLLKKMQAAQQEGGGHEIGVWVSGFYGSGKSSFTKYLGFSLDRAMKVGNDTFLHLLQNQLRSVQTKALFNQVSTVYDAAVIFLDLASEMLAGASMEDISNVLYLKVLQWAGYSEDLKVAELERMLEMEGRLDAFQARASEELDGIPWKEVRNQPLVANQIAARLAAEFYPKLFPTPEAFQNLKLHISKSELKRSEEMVDLIRRKSGKKNVIFVIDEVGQYVSAKPSLILNLDGLAKNLKQIGNGTVWLFATAQQTLTEDSPSAMLNAAGLFKLKDRFPITVHLEASDIREICHRRLLTKSASGEQELTDLFDSHGASLRTATKLKDAGVYEAELAKQSFVNLYPFLPAHFEILLQLLGRLARKTGGLGLRSAIKVIQDVLIERPTGQLSLADAETGALANTVTFYDSLRRDIQSTYSYITEGVERVRERFPNDELHQLIGKSIAVLQILENLPVTTQNIAALLQPAVQSASMRDEVEKTVAAILGDGLIPIGEKNGSLRFLTQAAVTLQKQFDEIEYRQADLRAELNGVLRTIFTPLPSARLNNVRPVTAGLRLVLDGGQSFSLDGDKEAIQLHVEFVLPGTYERTRTERENESRAQRERCHIHLLARSETHASELALTMVRCHKFLDLHRSAAEPDTQEFLRIIDSKLNRATDELQRKLTSALLAGSFIAHGKHQPVTESGATVQEAAKAFLQTAAAAVFDRYSEASSQVDTALAEKFLKTPLDRITSTEDPLGLVGRAGGRAQIRVDHKAMMSLRDFMEQQGQVEGRRILDHFASHPFGWSKDTTRYILAASFLAGELKLRLAGHDHVVKNDDTLAAFASNRAFGPAGISLRQERPDPDALVRAADRLRDLTGENILPLEDEIATAARKHFPTWQAAFGPLATELRQLGLAQGEQPERAENLVSDLTEVVSGDGSDAVSRLGSADSPFHDSLVWARKLKKALEQGLRVRLSHLHRLLTDLPDLPTSGVPARLTESASDTIAEVRDILARQNFFEESSSLARASDQLDKLVASTTSDLTREQQDLIASSLETWQNSPDWVEVAPEDQAWLAAEAAKLTPSVEPTLDGLKRLLSNDYTLNNRLRDLAASLARKAGEARAEREKVVPPPPSATDDSTLPAPAEVTKMEVLVPHIFSSTRELDLLIAELNRLRSQFAGSRQVAITWKTID